MKGIIAWFAHNSVAANLLMVALVVIGWASYPSIEQKSFPDFEIKIIQITIPYLGAAPEEVENGVCIRVEEAIQSINGIERINSLAAEGACTVSAELIEGYSDARQIVFTGRGRLDQRLDPVFPELVVLLRDLAALEFEHHALLGKVELQPFLVHLG